MSSALGGEPVEERGQHDPGRDVDDADHRHHCGRAGQRGVLEAPGVVDVSRGRVPG